MQALTHYAVSAERDGFRRAGRVWSRTATTVPAAELDETAIAALQADPSIMIVPCAADGPRSPEAEPRAPGNVPSCRAALIRAAIGALEQGDASHWTKDGRPDVAALKAASGLASLTSTERDAAWEQAA